MPLVHTSVVGDGSIRDHEFAHLSGVRSNIQQQIDGLVSNNTPPAWGSGKVWKHCKGDPAANANLLTHNTPMKVRRFQVQTQSHFSDAPYPTDNGMSANALVTDRLFTAPRTGVYVVHIDAVIRLENEPENDDGFVLDAVFNLEHANTSVLNRRFTKILDSPPSWGALADDRPLHPCHCTTVVTMQQGTQLDLEITLDGGGQLHADSDFVITNID